MEVSMDKEKMMQIAFENGSKCEQDYRGCNQCTIAAIQDALGIRNDCVYKAGSGLAGGLGECTDGVCGGSSGGAMMISLIFGRSRKEEGSEKGRADKHISFHLTAALHDKFVDKYGSIMCASVQKKILGRSFDLRSNEEKELFREAGAHDIDKCCGAVGDGARWTVEIILDEMEKRGLTLEDLRKFIYIEK